VQLIGGSYANWQVSTECSLYLKMRDFV